MTREELLERAKMLAGEDSLDAVLDLASEIVADDANVEPHRVREYMLRLAAGVVRLVPALRTELAEAHEALTVARAEVATLQAKSKQLRELVEEACDEGADAAQRLDDDDACKRLSDVRRAARAL